MSWGIHNCSRDVQCRADYPNPPDRWHFNTPWGSLLVALDPEHGSQIWLPWLGYTDWWARVAWHPRANSNARG